MTESTRESAVVLFDWNGTVVLDADRAQGSLNSVLHRRGLPRLDADGFAREFHLPMRHMFERLGASDTAAAEREWNHEMTAKTTAAREGTDTLRALALAGTRLGVVSAAAAGSVHTDMNALGLDDIWDSVDAPAPDKIAVLRARRGNETHAYYFGDTVYDMQSARPAGYTPTAVDRGYTDTGILRQAGATAVLTTFDELPSVLAHPMTTTQRR